MQYEIIAKQLTLLRDEVGPGERLVFLELPQSLNTSQDRTKNMIAQVWWRISGYTKANPNTIFINEVNDLSTAITKAQNDLDTLVTGEKGLSSLKNTTFDDLTNLKREREVLFAELQNICAGKQAISNSNTQGNEKCVEDRSEHEGKMLDERKKVIESSIKEAEKAIQALNDEEIKQKREEFRLSQSLAALRLKYDKLKFEALRRKISDQQETADRLWQGGGEKVNDVVEKVEKILTPNLGFTKFNYNKSPDNQDRQFISLEPTETPNANLRRRDVRTIDIIPRQNALNVNDTKESVNSTGIVAAFSFLFGFGGNVRYQRQREQFEQFLNQELYTSGFGKGQTDFGWTFYPLAGTKQIAPGVRTTYAVAIIPEDAETIVLKAKGCYMDRKDLQPDNYDAAVNQKHYSCSTDEQAFVIPIPGGSGGEAGFYATGIRYSPFRKSGERMVASITGQNFSPQIGVLIDGVPLTPAVGLAQPAIESIIEDKVAGTCENGVCGRFERINSSQLIISFNMPDGFRTTPRITLVAPGKAIELNKLLLNINGTDDVSLDDSDFMFGRRDSKAAISIDNFKITSDSTHGMRGVLTGSGFDKVGAFYINGDPIVCQGSSPALAATTKSLCMTKEFSPTSEESVIVTLIPQDKDEAAISETFGNPYSLKIIDHSILDFQTASDKGPAILTVKIDGSGFSSLKDVLLDRDATANGAKIRKTTIPSSGQIVLEIESPGPVVQIVLRNENTSVSLMVDRPIIEKQDSPK